MRSERVRALLAEGAKPSQDTMTALREHIDEDKEDLIELLRDQTYWSENSPGEGYGPLHAASLLIEEEVTEAIQPMLDALFECDPDSYLYNHIVVHMGEMGEVVVEPCLQTLHMEVVTADRLKDLDAQSHVVHGISSILAACGVKDERIYELLVHLTLQDPITCHDLSVYGDKRALPLLLDLFDEWEPSYDNTAFIPIELQASVQKLGGTLSPKHEEKVAQSIELRKELFSRPRPSASGKKSRPKPNERCWCGSGKKYKKCHMLEDEKR